MEVCVVCCSRSARAHDDGDLGSGQDRHIGHFKVTTRATATAYVEPAAAAAAHNEQLPDLCYPEGHRPSAGIGGRIIGSSENHHRLRSHLRDRPDTLGGMRRQRDPQQGGNGR